MKNVVIKLSDYGSNLGSRLHGRDIISSIKNDVIIADKIVVDFEGIKQISLSFGTEVFDSLYSLNGNIETINENHFVATLVKFCKANLKPRCA